MGTLVQMSENFESKIMIINFAYDQGFQEVDHLNSLNQQTCRKKSTLNEGYYFLG